MSSVLPWIGNFVPSPESTQVKLLKPIRLSVRDRNTFIDPSSLRVIAGYAKVYSNADQYFDKQLADTIRTNLYYKRGTEPVLSLTPNGVFVQQLGDLNERTLYATSLDAGTGYKSVMLTAILRPGVDNAESGGLSAGPLNSSVFPGPLLPIPFNSGVGNGGGGSGAVLAIENGARNKVIYLWLQNSDTRVARLTSYLTNDEDNPPAINIVQELDWDAYNRYTILWNEASGVVEVYSDGTDSDRRIFSVPIDTIPDMPSDYVRIGTTGKMTALYGLVATAALDSVTISNVAFTTDVGFPVLGNIRPGSFVTYVKGTELIRTSGDVDPRESIISSWLDMPETLMPNRDNSAVGAATAGIFRMTKPTIEKTFALYREEPGLLKSDDDGWMVEASIHASPTATVGAATGMGFTIFDGQSVFQMQLFKDPGFKTIGVLKKNGSDFDITEYYLPETNFDWDGGAPFRLICDPRRAVMNFYDCEDLNTPIMSVPFDRATLPSAADKGWTDKTPFIAIGHTMDLATAGDFQLHEISFCHLYQSWESTDGNVPTGANPAFGLTSSGAVSDSITSDGDFEIVSAPGALYKLSRNADFEANRGAIVEAQVKITSWRPFTRTGTYLFLDDGLHVYGLTFVETNVGKFAALTQRSSLGSFQEIVGRDGDAAKVSFLIDWTQYHTYRLERIPYGGVKVFVDNESEPRIVFAESKLGQLPDPQYGGTPTLAFGQFTTEGSTSRWRFVRSLFSRGYDISFKKNKPDGVLRTELFKTQALIVAHAQDEDV